MQTTQKIRLGCLVGAHPSQSATDDVLTGKPPALWRGNPVTFEIGLLNKNGDGLADGTATTVGVTAITVDIWSEQKPSATLLASKTFTGSPTVIVYDNWTSGDYCHASVSFTEAEMNFSINSAAAADLWLVVSVTVGGNHRTVYGGPLTVYEDVSPVGSTFTPPPTPSYYSAEQCDARFAPIEIDADHVMQHLLAGRYITFTRVNQAGQGTSNHGEKISVSCTMPDPPTPPALPAPTEEIVMRGNGVGGVYYTVPGRQMALEVSTYTGGEVNSWSDYVDVKYPADGDGYLAADMEVSANTTYRLRAKTLWGTTGPAYEFTTADIPASSEEYPGITAETGYSFQVIIPNLPGDALNWSAVEVSVDGFDWTDGSSYVPDLTPGAYNQIAIPVGETHSYSFRLAASNCYGQGPFSAASPAVSGTGVLPSQPAAITVTNIDTATVDLTMPSLPANAQYFRCCIMSVDSGEWVDATNYGLSMDLTPGNTTRFTCPSQEAHTYDIVAVATNACGEMGGVSTGTFYLVGGS